MKDEGMKAEARRLYAMGTSLIVGILVWVTCSTLLAGRQAEPPVAPGDILYKVGPRYPREMMRSGIGGTGRYRMLVDVKTGKVTSVAILKSSGSDELDREAFFTLRRWRFRPGKITKVDLPITWQASGTVYWPPGARPMPNR